MDKTDGSVADQVTDQVTGQTGTTTPARELETLRAELDAVDGRILDAVRERIEICVRIAHLKRRHAIPMMQPQRVNAVEERARRYARTHRLSPAFFQSLYELLIGETCRVEDLIIDAADDLESEIVDLSGAYPSRG